MPPSVPRATYRLQLHAGFTFADAQAIIPYLADLGISHLYVSPFLKARPGSLHGYDIVDHNQINPEIGDRAGLEALAAELKAHDMGLILDFVPNHMGVGGSDNEWWLDVLEWGEDSPFAGYFDIDWRPGRRELTGKVLLPFLGDHYGAILERGELQVKLDEAEGSISVWYWEHRHPIRPADYPGLLTAVLTRLKGSPAGEALEDVITLARPLVSQRAGLAQIAARRALAHEVKGALAQWVADWPAVAEPCAAAFGDIAAEPYALHRLLQRQHYRISYWRVAADEINYRRFFDINDLAGLRIERAELFTKVHALVFDLLRADIIQGLRIDHIDGLYHPAEYCRRLQALAGRAMGREDEDQPLYLLVEKILAHHEKVRRDWPVAGTTGYDFMVEANALFVEENAAAAMDRSYAGFIANKMDFEAETRSAKKAVMDQSMAAELRVLAVELGRIAESHWASRDFTISGLRQAIREVVACFPVYRTYVTGRRVTDNDRRYIDWALACARNQGDGDQTIFDFLHGIMTTALGRGPAPLYSRRAVLDFAMSLQQYTGPVTAKGFEDTVLYRYNRLIALNEVGGEPTRFGTSIKAFHGAMRYRRRSFPNAMLATATHDAKRGEDVRLRIGAVSFMAQDWAARVERWAELNQQFRRDLEDGPAPDRNDEYFLYQTLIGAWPDDPADLAGFPDRMVAAMVKSVREAKRRTSWHHMNEGYEQALENFVRRILDDDRRNPFLDDFLEFRQRAARIGMVHSLAQTLIKLSAPGVPDLYQGSEVWHLALVDPDNRRPVDYELRRRLLAGTAEASPRRLLEQWQDGAIKLKCIAQALALRRANPDLFAQGEYQPLTVRGPFADSMLAFARIFEAQAVICVVPVRIGRAWPEGYEMPPLAGAWRGMSIEIPKNFIDRTWREVLTGRDITPQTRPDPRRPGPFFAAADLFAEWPVALLTTTD